jgi:hypothetical protein
LINDRDLSAECGPASDDANTSYNLCLNRWQEENSTIYKYNQFIGRCKERDKNVASPLQPKPDAQGGTSGRSVPPEQNSSEGNTENDFNSRIEAARKKAKTSASSIEELRMQMDADEITFQQHVKEITLREKKEKEAQQGKDKVLISTES